MQIDPIIQALVHNPSRLFEKSVAESFVGPPAVIARIVVGRAYVIEPLFVQLNTPTFDIIDQQVKYRNRIEFLKCFGKPCLQTIPGRQIGVPSFRP